MRLLAIDTATEACSAALLAGGDISEQYTLAPREHSHLILPMIERLLQDAGLRASDLDLLAFGRGPGSFMGLRIAAGVVQGIGFAHDLPVVPVSTLQALALNAMHRSGYEKVLTAIDARMKEVYWAGYEQHDDGIPRCVLAERVVAPGAVEVPVLDQWLGAGTGWQTYAGVLGERCEVRVGATLPECFPSAAAIAEIAVFEFHAGRTVPAAAAVPVYLRDKVATKPKPKPGPGA